MSSHIFEDIFFVFLLTTIFLLPLIWWRISGRLKYLQKLARINILKRQQKLDGTQIYASAVIDKCVSKLYFSTSSTAKKTLVQLVIGRVMPAVKFLQTSNFVLATLLLGHQNSALAMKMLRNNKDFTEFNRHLAAICPLLALQTFEQNQAQIWLSQISRYKLKRLGCAYYDYAQTHVCLNQGDMQSAVKNIEYAVKVFRQMQYFMEEAACYMKLAEIYRLCCMNDMAQAMLSAAADIYKKLNSPLHLSATIAAKGMLMLFENRLDEAVADYEKALGIVPSAKLSADILNQYALLEIINNKLVSAQKKIKETRKFYKKTSNNIGLAFSIQLEGQVAYADEKYQKSAKLLQQAADLYLQHKNYTAYAESTYTAANCLCKLGKYATAEKLLQQILRCLHRRNNSFHQANIYALLGLINMKNNCLSTAEKWLKKSLGSEQKNQRYSGIAVDYVNLAIIKQLQGNIKQACKYSALALEYAQKTADEEFIDLVKNKILR